MRLTQTQAGERIGVNPWTVLNWEKGRTKPPIEAVPVVLGFLGYDPFPAPKTLSERLLAQRRTMGWSIRKAAWQLGVDPGTWRDWEQGKTVLFRRHRVLVGRLLDFSVGSLDQEMASRWNQSHKRES